MANALEKELEKKEQEIDKNKENVIVKPIDEPENSALDDSIKLFNVREGMFIK